jgi:hypothetical protein
MAVPVPIAAAAMPSRRRFYAHAWLFFLAALLLTVAGFWSSFFSRPAALSGPRLLHGVVSTAWLVLALVQAGLMRLDLRRWHRTVGRLGYLVMPLLIVTGAWVLHLMLSGQTRLPKPLTIVLGFIDLGTLLFLAIAFTAAMIHRRDPQSHARWMATTILVVLPPALTRLVFAIHPQAAFDVALGLAYAAVVGTAAILVVVDWRGGRLRWSYPSALVYLAGTYALLGHVAASPAWQSAAAWIGGR